eukprot:1196221-Prorocentrum_minimum.AAC.1
MCLVRQPIRANQSQSEPVRTNWSASPSYHPAPFVVSEGIQHAGGGYSSCRVERQIPGRSRGGGFRGEVFRRLWGFGSASIWGPRGRAEGASSMQRGWIGGRRG